VLISVTKFIYKPKLTHFEHGSAKVKPSKNKQEVKLENFENEVQDHFSAKQHVRQLI